MILLPLNDRIPMSPSVPAARPPCDEPERLGGVLDQRHAVLRAQRHDGVVVGALAVQVDRHHRRGQPTRCVGRRQLVGQQLRVDVPRHGLAVDEPRCRARVRHRVRRRGERERRDQHVVARPDAVCEQREVQSRRAARHRHRARPPRERCEVGLERVEFRPRRGHPAAVEGAQQRLAFERPDVGRAQQDPVDVAHGQRAPDSVGHGERGDRLQCRRAVSHGWRTYSPSTRAWVDGPSTLTSVRPSVSTTDTANCSSITIGWGRTASE